MRHLWSTRGARGPPHSEGVIEESRTDLFASRQDWSVELSRSSASWDGHPHQGSAKNEIRSCRVARGRVSAKVPARGENPRSSGWTARTRAECSETKKSEEQSTLFQRTPAVEDPQAAWWLLLICAFTRANYRLRCVRPDVTEAFAHRHDASA